MSIVYLSIGPVLRQLLNKPQYEDQVRYRIVLELETHKYSLVGRPDWPAYSDAIESGEFTLVMSMTGKELKEAYVEFNKVQGRLFDELHKQAGLEIGQQLSRGDAKRDVPRAGDRVGGSSKDDAGSGERNNGGASNWENRDWHDTFYF